MFPPLTNLRMTEYQKLSMRTAPPFKSRELSPIQDYYNHAAQGLCTEVAEIVEDQDNQENVLQEIGDVLWYVALFCTGLGIDVEDLPGSVTRYDDVYDELVKQSGIVNDCVKRHIYYTTIEKKVELDETKCEKALGAIVTALRDLSNDRLEQCMVLNVEKLRLRYPDKFDADKAVNRDVAKEAKLFRENN